MSFPFFFNVSGFSSIYKTSLLAAEIEKEGTSLDNGPLGSGKVDFSVIFQKYSSIDFDINIVVRISVFIFFEHNFQ